MRQFRLADRRGLLTGTELSHLQAFALEMMLALEDRRDLEAAATGIKLALVSHSPQTLTKLFPEVAVDDEGGEQEEETVEYVEASESDIGQPGAWEFTPMTPADRDVLRGQIEGTFSMDDLDDGGWV